MNSQFTSALILMIIMSLMTAGGQVLIKWGLRDSQGRKGLKQIIQMCFKLPVFAGFILALGAPLVYIQALRLLSLSGVYGLNGITYIFVFTFSHFILKEEITRLHILGLLLIVGGVTLWSI